MSKAPICDKCVHHQCLGTSTVKSCEFGYWKVGESAKCDHRKPIEHELQPITVGELAEIIKVGQEVFSEPVGSNKAPEQTTESEQLRSNYRVAIQTPKSPFGEVRYFDGIFELVKDNGPDEDQSIIPLSTEEAAAFCADNFKHTQEAIIKILHFVDEDENNK